MELACEEIVYRVITAKRWIDGEGHITADAFLMTKESDATTGLSVSRASLCSVENAAQKFNASFGVDSLHTGHVKNLELSIAQTTEELDHAGILGLPRYFDKDNLAVEELKRAEDLAGALAKQARLQSRTRWRRT